uniref:Uncharacterized protein n=1 Tax=Arion vulgaris TaxID=1028688 RepID=A0A0B7B0D9_9EUPU
MVGDTSQMVEAGLHAKISQMCILDTITTPEYVVGERGKETNQITFHNLINTTQQTRNATNKTADMFHN